MIRSWLFAIALVACAPSPLGTQATMPDPPPPQADTPTRERPDFFWIHGHWLWKDNNHWDWTSGHWEHVRTGYSWTEGAWQRRGGTWQYVEGAWTAGEAPPSPPATEP